MKYMYLLICVSLFIPWIIIFLKNKFLRKRMLKAGLMAAPFGVINMWFRIDYWNAPEVLLINEIISLEDALFGFLATGISVSIYDAFFTENYIKSENNRLKTVGLFFIFVFVSFFILNNCLGLNSMFMFCIPLLILNIVIITIRKDLLAPCLLTALFCVLIATPIYMFLFNYVSPNFWNTYWFLSGTKLGWTVFGNVPVLELLWYFSWGSFAGILYDFASGTKKVLKQRNK